MTLPVRELFDTAGKNFDQDVWLRKVLEKEVERLADLRVPDIRTESSCLLADMGDFFVHILGVLSNIAASLAHGQDISIYSASRIEEHEKENDFSELGWLDYLNEKHEVLKLVLFHLKLNSCIDNPCRLVASNIRFTAESMEALWNDSPSPPFQQARMNSTSSTSGSDQASTQYSAAMPLNRGKGQHQCPYGEACTKGGLGPDGQLVTFERNSSFRLASHNYHNNCLS